MLRNRILTALVLIPLVVWGVLALPTPWFTLITLLVMLAGAWEWNRLIPMPQSVPTPTYPVLIGALCALLYLFPDTNLQAVILAAAVLWWMVVLLWVRMPMAGKGNRLFKLLVGLITLVPAWLALMLLHEQPQWVLYLLVTIWLADSGAYFAGRRFGRNKLAPKVSPGKTWEGVAGGLLASLLFALAVGSLLDWAGLSAMGFVVLTLVVAAVSILGDLQISLLKRQQGLKDSGKLIPGHGGVLDRIDSLTAAAPVFVFGLRWLGN